MQEAWKAEQNENHFSWAQRAEAAVYTDSLGAADIDRHSRWSRGQLTCGRSSAGAGVLELGSC